MKMRWGEGGKRNKGKKYGVKKVTNEIWVLPDFFSFYIILRVNQFINPYPFSFIEGFFIFNVFVNFV